MTIREVAPDETAEVLMAGHYHPSRVVRFGDTWYAMSAGSADDVTFWSTPLGIAVLTANYGYRSIAYVGVELLEPDAYRQRPAAVDDGTEYLQPTTVVFWQDPQPGDIGPRNTLDYAPRTIVRRALDMYYEL